MPKVLLIGWDAADWKIINPLLEQGLMPTLESLINEGCMGNISTLDPPLSPILWTSIATGKLADKHGILGFTEPNPSATGVQPVSGSSRKCNAIWNILSKQGYKTHVVGWWPSHPAEPVNGIMLSNFYYKGTDTEKPLPEGTVYPNNLTGLFEHLRVSPAELNQNHLIPFVPDAASYDLSNEEKINNIAGILAEAATVQNAATWIMDHAEWDFLGVYFNAIDLFGHQFMHFHPPKLKDIDEAEFERYKEVVTSSYRFHDMMLETLLKKTDKDTTVILMSDHGFHSDHLRQGFIPAEPAAPAMQHREHGILVIKGPGIKKDELIHGASLLNITPTILQVFGLPIAKDMDGVPLVQVFENTPEIKTIESWDEKTTNTTLNRIQPIDPETSRMALQQLIDLGYIDDPGEDAMIAVEKTQNEANYNLARVYISSNRAAKAIPLLENLSSHEPLEGRFALRLVRCYMETGNYSLARATLELFVDLTTKHKAGIDANDPDKKALTCSYWLAQAEIVNADLLLLENKTEEASQIFKKMLDINPSSVGLLNKQASAFMALNKLDDASDCYNRILELNPQSEQAFQGLAQLCLQRGLFEEAAGYALDAIGVNFRQPNSHYILALALLNLGQTDKAADALEVCLKMLPNFAQARKTLIDIYLQNNQSEKAKEHELWFSNGQQPEVNTGIEALQKAIYHTKQIEPQRTVFIVSGLPRSGTSAMMQMLANGGMPIFTDNLRVADESNQRGYFEHEAVKGLAVNNQWLSEATGKAVKVIAQLVPHLPPRFNYNIIFMERNMDEIIASQHKMLIRNGKHKEGAYPAGLNMIYNQRLKDVKDWLGKQPNVNVLYVNYNEMVNNPEQVACDVAQFTGTKLDEVKMAHAVDPAFYRERNK